MTATAARCGAHTGIGPAVALAGVLCLGLMGHRSHPAPLPAILPGALPLPSSSPFQASLERAQGWYVLARMNTASQLESLEEWDPDGIQGRDAEAYRRSILAQTWEIGEAETMARAALRWARTTEETYRAIRLLTRIEGDRGNRWPELALAKRAAALRPHDPGALLLLERAALDNGQTSLARRVEASAHRAGTRCAMAPEFFTAFSTVAFSSGNQAGSGAIASRRLAGESPE